MTAKDQKSLEEACVTRGLPVSLEILLRHIDGNHQAIMGAKDYLIELLQNKSAPADMLSLQQNVEEAQIHLRVAANLMSDFRALPGLRTAFMEANKCLSRVSELSMELQPRESPDEPMVIGE